MILRCLVIIFFEKGCGSLLHKLTSFSYQNALNLVGMIFGTLLLEEKILRYDNEFLVFRYHLPLKGYDLAFLHPRMFWCSGEKKNLKYCQCLSVSVISPPPLQKGMDLYPKTFEFFLPRNALCQVWLTFGPAALDKKVFRFRQCTFCTWL